MGFFDHLHSNGSGAIKPRGSKVVRKILTKSGPPSGVPRPPSQARLSNSPQPTSRRAPSSKVVQANGDKDSARSSPSLQPSKPAKGRKRPSPTQQRLVSSDEDDDGDDSDLALGMSRKRTKTSVESSEEPDLKRRVRSDVAFAPEGSDVDLQFVHAADIASVEKSSKYAPAFEASEEELDVALQYPSLSPRERFNLVRPQDKEDYTPVDDILQVIELTAKHHLPSDQAERFLEEEHGIHRRLKRAIARKSVKEFRGLVEEYNEAIVRLAREEVITKNLDNSHSIALPMVEHILTQTYARTVSLKVDTLKKYENGSDNVYGELLPRFVSKIFQETKLKSDHVMVDLGSGVANVVLQAALEIGCESWGCEMMDNACDLAELQQKEFAARCQLWGLAPGEMHLERGDFLRNTNIGKVLQRADLVVVNNQAFTPRLNDGLVNLFLDLKEGCQIVSLKSFVPHDHKISSRNFNSPVNLLNVETKTYFSNCVSWTNAPGTYFVARKDSRKLRAFAKQST
ncbi:MAG: Nucleosomal histone H3-Lys79 methylase [Sclerophora amabilis]|nr:MAG: Nucleosomal histone H3-Lys79 methylase [Sclerophora amabilis]